VRASAPGGCRRKHTRYDVTLSVRISSGDGGSVYDARCLNLSVGGMYVAGTHALSEGDAVRLWLKLPDSGELFMTGQVIWTEDEGVGVAQQLLGSDDTFRLTQFLATLKDED
jgi:Tfp pilus assembly protein PilZ